MRWDPLGFRDRQFYRLLLRIALPIMIQQFFAAALHIVDTIMVSGLGEVEVAAVGLANKYSFIANLFFFGITSGAAVFVAQFWGAQNRNSIHKVMSLSLILAQGAGLIFFLPALISPESVMGIFSPDPLVIQSGSAYLRIIGFTYLISTLVQVLSTVLRSTESVRLPMMASVAGLITNTILNYMLIFGNWGAPRLGVEGAAYATVISSLLTLALVLVFSYLKKNIIAVKPRELKPPNMVFIKQYFKTAFPVLINEGIWGLGSSSYSVVFGHMGTQVAAAMNIFSSIEQLVFVAAMSLAHATGVMIGTRIGAGEEEKAKLYSRRLCNLSITLGLILGLGIVFARDAIGAVFNFNGQISAEVMQLFMHIVLVFGLFAWLRFFNALNVVGVLRAGGDTKFCTLLDLVPMWTISVPLAFILGLVVKVPIQILYPLIFLDEIVKFFIGIWRQRSGKWIRNLTHISEKQVEAT